MKKLIALLLALMLMATMFAGCSKSNGDVADNICFYILQLPWKESLVLPLYDHLYDSGRVYCTSTLSTCK